MKTSERSATHSIADAAGDWFLRRQAGLTAAEQVEFEAWVAADARHASELEQFAATWRELNQPREQGFAEVARQTLEHRRTQRVRRRKKAAFFATGLAAAALVAVAMTPFGLGARPHGLPQSVVMRPDRQTLPDGSTVEQNAGSRYEVLFSAHERRIRLIRGEAHFTVAKDPARPFVVAAGAVAVRAVGTAFSVRHDPVAVEVLVTEGRVAVERISTEPPISGPVRVPAPPTLVSAGGRVTVPVTISPPAALPSMSVTPAQLAQSLAWRHKRIEFTETPLAEVLDLFNRENTLQLQVGDADTAKLEVSGIFWSNDAETFVRLVETGLNLQSERSANRIVLRRR
ncbi:MAG: FecR domain-containing protein [Opitutaceae bacterium]|nr:FecR domain-containing protein [Opitutaceae bacterium]